MANPDPARITDEMWKLWTDRPNPSWRLGGIYANKKCYHNSVNANLANKDWDDAYCVGLSLDLVYKNRDKARAIDYTMSTSEMIKTTTRLKNSALDPDDHRLAAVREFYGTLDGHTVYGLIKDNLYGPWRRSSANLSHLWHIHEGFFTAFVDDWGMLAPNLSVLKGEALEEWEGVVMLPKRGDSGETVKYWQQLHNTVRNIVSPPSPALTIDATYGTQSATAFLDFWKKSGGISDNYDGSYITGWLGVQYHKALAKLYAAPPPVVTPVPTEKIQEAVNTWFANNIDTVRPVPPTKISLDAVVTDYE